MERTQLLIQWTLSKIIWKWKLIISPKLLKMNSKSALFVKKHLPNWLATFRMFMSVRNMFVPYVARSLLLTNTCNTDLNLNFGWKQALLWYLCWSIFIRNTLKSVFLSFSETIGIFYYVWTEFLPLYFLVYNWIFVYNICFYRITFVEFSCKVFPI